MIIIMANDYNLIISWRMIIINKNRPIRFKIKGLIIIVLSEPRNDYNHTSAPNRPRWARVGL